MGTLRTRLESLPQDEFNLHLARVLRDFSGTESWEALQIVLENFEGGAMGVLLNPATQSDARTFAAGVVSVIGSLRSALNMAATLAIEPLAPAVERPSEEKDDDDDDGEDDGDLVEFPQISTPSVKS